MSKKTRTRLSGVGDLARMAMGRNHAISTIRNTRDTYIATHKIVKGRDPRLPKALKYL
jgi:hypothetical protein